MRTLAAGHLASKVVLQAGRRLPGQQCRRAVGQCAGGGGPSGCVSLKVTPDTPRLSAPPDPPAPQQVRHAPDRTASIRPP